MVVGPTPLWLGGVVSGFDRISAGIDHISADKPLLPPLTFGALSSLSTYFFLALPPHILVVVDSSLPAGTRRGPCRV